MYRIYFFEYSTRTFFSFVIYLSETRSPCCAPAFFTYERFHTRCVLIPEYLSLSAWKLLRDNNVSRTPSNVHAHAYILHCNNNERVPRSVVYLRPWYRNNNNNNNNNDYYYYYYMTGRRVTIRRFSRLVKYISRFVIYVYARRVLIALYDLWTLYECENC